MITKDWWKSLNHNWKKNLIVNLDFSIKFPKQYEFLKSELISKGPYNAYKNYFNLGIRKRLDTFDNSENEIKKIINLEYLVLNHIELDGIGILNDFKNLEHLTISKNRIKDFKEIPKFERLKSLYIGECYDLINLDNISKLQGLEKLRIIYCYKLENINDLKLCKNLKHIDLYYLGKTIELNPLLGIDEILVHKNFIHCADKIYNERFGELKKGEIEYTINEMERMIIHGNEGVVKNNYLNFIDSEKYKIILNGYSEWKLKKQ